MRGVAATIRAREHEIDAVGSMLASAARGAGGALVVHGEAGIGKTVLHHAIARAAGVRTLRAAGAEFEMELAYAALHQLCAPLLGLRERLPPRQRGALEAVLGMGQDSAAEPLLVSLALLGLLAESGEERPLVCVVDDAQWVDAASLQAFSFAARRIGEERVAFLFAVREPDGTPELAGLDRVAIPPLPDAAARALLADEVHVALEDAVRDRIVAEARGNPLALLELPSGAGAVRLAGGFDALADRPVAGLLEERFAERVSGLPDDAQAFVTLAAAEPLGDPELVRRAAEVMALDAGAAEAAEASGLLSLGPPVRFRHPLARSAAYRGAPPAERRRAHAALAASTDAVVDPDRRAWHRAHAAAHPDDDVAGELERSAARAQMRGGLAAAAAFLARAAELSTDPADRAARHLAAARARFEAGDPDGAVELLGRAGETPQARLLRALIAFHRTRSPAATTGLLEAVSGLDPAEARETLMLALSSATFIDRLPGRLQALARDVGTRAPVLRPPRPVDRLLDALIEQATSQDAAAVRAMQQAVIAFRDDSSGSPRWLDLAALMAVDLYDDTSAVLLADRGVHLARRQGHLTALADALNMQAMARLIEGRFAEAAASVAEAHAIEDATGAVGMPYGDAILAAWQGDADRVDAIFDAVHHGVGREDINAELYARAVLLNGLSRYDAALQAALRADAQEREGAYVMWQLGPELVEAAVRGGAPEHAEQALDRIVRRARAIGTDWALGAELRCRALLADDADADALYLEAIDRLNRTTARTALARAQLVYGEWLRRRQRRVEARTQLRSAHERFDAMGAEGFTQRAARELEATGEHPRRRSVDLLDALTAQELHIAKHVAAGATSKEVAGELFLSPRTIDAHLRSVFRKLGISSRRQLRDLDL